MLESHDTSYRNTRESSEISAFRLEFGVCVQGQTDQTPLLHVLDLFV